MSEEAVEVREREMSDELLRHKNLHSCTLTLTERRRKGKSGTRSVSTCICLCACLVDTQTDTRETRETLDDKTWPTAAAALLPPSPSVPLSLSSFSTHNSLSLSRLIQVKRFLSLSLPLILRCFIVVLTVIIVHRLSRADPLPTSCSGFSPAK